MVVPTINGFLDDHYRKHLRSKAPKLKNAEPAIDEIPKLGDVLPGSCRVVPNRLET